MKNKDRGIILKYISKKEGVENWSGLFRIGINFCGGLSQQGIEKLGCLRVMELSNCGTVRFSCMTLRFGTDVTDKNSENMKYCVKQSPEVYRINIRNKGEILYGTCDIGTNDPISERCGVKNRAK
jgi:hypothetical protein